MTGRPRVEDGADHLVGVGVGVVDARHVHHLAERGDAVPRSASRMSSGPRSRAGVLEAGQRGHAGRDGEEDLQRQAAALLEHPADAVEAEDVGDLVVVDEDGRRAVRQDRLGEPRDRDHRRLDVEMRVDEARDEVGAAGVEELRVRAARVARVAEHGDAAVLDRDVGAVEDLAGVDVDEAPARDQEVGGRAAHADVRERAGRARQRARVAAGMAWEPMPGVSRPAGRRSSTAARGRARRAVVRVGEPAAVEREAAAADAFGEPVLEAPELGDARRRCGRSSSS